MQQKFGLNIPRTLEEICDPTRMALLVYDMQVGRRFPNSKWSRNYVARLRLLQAAREGGFRVFFNRYMTLPKEVAGVSQLRMAMDWQHVDSIDKIQPRFLRDSPEFQICSELSPITSEAVFDRITMSAFEGTPLNMVLRDCGINAFVIAGVATEVGIEPTVRHAADLGYIPVIATDACGAGNEAAAQRSLDSLRFAGNAVMTDTDTISKIFRRQPMKSR
jgi:biuret amidohydrolase